MYTCLIGCFLTLLSIPAAARLAKKSEEDVISIPLTAPQSAASISPSHFSFSIEQDRWLSWAGNGSRNDFVYNALDNIKQLTGEPPWIRIGGDSEDHTIFDSSVQFAEGIFPKSTRNVPYPEASNITVGDGFYQAVSSFPAGTRVIWGVPFGKGNITAAYLETESILKAFDSSAVQQQGITLEFLEIGNEPDLYGHNHLRNPATWNITTYIELWSKYALFIAASVSASTGSSITGPKLLAGSFASSTAADTGFSPQSLISGGILDQAAGSQITSISQHHYSGSFCTGSGGLLSDLMNKAYIRGNLTYFRPDIVAVEAAGLDYVFGETNSYACHGAPGVSNTAGAALWALDYGLFASQVGVSRLHFHQGVGYKYNFIQPVTLYNSTNTGSPLSKPSPPHVQPAYYAAIIAAEAIGSTGSTFVQELDIDDPQVSGYAFYEGSVLARAVFINSATFFGGEANRTSTHIDLAFNGTGIPPAAFTIRRLSIQHANDTSGLTWGGQSYETADARVNGTLSVETDVVSVGFDIQETEAVLLSFD